MFQWVWACSVTQLRPTLCSPMDCIASQASLTREFSSREYWSGLAAISSCRGSSLHLLTLLFWQADSLLLSHLGILAQIVKNLPAMQETEETWVRSLG